MRMYETAWAWQGSIGRPIGPAVTLTRSGGRTAAERCRAVPQALGPLAATAPRFQGRALPRT